jgi:uncharacterized repeat protein (TIGR03803 family)
MVLLLLTFHSFSAAQGFTTLLSFGGSVGEYPFSALTQGLDGNLYGTLSTGGGLSGGGTVYTITPTGNLTTKYTFCSQPGCADGANPYASLTLASDGSFYGVTSQGGANAGCAKLPHSSYKGCGTVFKMTAAGSLTTLYSFCTQTECADGANPYNGLVQADDGNFYGTTVYGGANNYGTVFKISATGQLSTLYSFCSVAPGCADGAYPYGALVQGDDGNLYGLASTGGQFHCGGSGCGTLFKITTGGSLTTVLNFDGSDGSTPYGTLNQSLNGNFLAGTTSKGGLHQVQGGVAFKITSSGAYTKLYDFCELTKCADGLFPSDLIQATDGNFYGTTQEGGNGGPFRPYDGTIFKMAPTGKVSTLHDFCSQSDCTDGAYPMAALVQRTDGTFYGTTNKGGTFSCGADGCGTLFKLSVGLAPFIETITTSGHVGSVVTILGDNLGGATSVSFNGTSATFTILSGTEIKTTVPAAATSGFVDVKTPVRKLKSNKVFRVLQ